VVNLPADPEQNGWLTLAEAADRLGISIYTIRRQVKRGELKAEQVATRHGLAWRVSLSNLPGVAPTLSSEPNQVAQGQGLDSLKLLEMLDERDRTIMELSGRLGFLQAELQQRDEQLKALQAPHAEPTPESPPGTAAPAEDRPRASWWRRVLLGE
jgi:excisionase family DNA binding protein